MKSGNIIDGKQFFCDKNIPCEILQHSTSSVTPHRSVLVWYYPEICEFLKVFQNFTCVASLDATHNISESLYSHLLSLMVRMPDTLKFVIIAQAVIEGEDSESIQLFLQWFTSQNQLLPNIILIDDSAAEKCAIRNVWGNAIVCICMWHIMKTIQKHFDFQTQSIVKIFAIQRNFTNEVLLKFQTIASKIPIAIFTQQKEKCDEIVLQITHLLNELECWWNSKETLGNVRNWWAGYQQRISDWALSYRLSLYPNYANLFLQEKTTGKSESFHSVLKENRAAKLFFRSCDLVKSLIGIYNASGRWNDNHKSALRDIYFLRTTSNFRVQFSVMRDLLPPCVFEKMSRQWALFQSILKTSQIGIFK